MIYNLLLFLVSLPLFFWLCFANTSLNNEFVKVILTFDQAYDRIYFFTGKFTAVAARGGMETLRPALQRVYMTRASAYRDALKSFIEGYQEGVQQVMEKKEDSKTQEDADLPKKST